MINMGLVILFTILVTVTYVQASSQTFSPCAVTLCVTNTVCREVLNRTSGVISAVCLDPTLYPLSRHDKVCSDGQPLWIVSSTGGYSEAACGRVVDRTTCPGGYRCVIAPNDAYSLCCPVLVKSGQCPVPAPDTVGICAHTCQSDSDCDDDLKCCRNPCGALTCQSPDVTTAYTCQLVDCQPGKICIDTPTGPQCVFPTRDGKCPAPRISSGYPGCLSRCHKDADCPGVQKCCPAGPFSCGRECRDPEPSRTCENTKCPAGQTCIMVQPQCRVAPCFPLPVCTDRELTCPFFPAYIDPNCVQRDLCRSDAHCPRGQLCCTTPCGRRCFTPR